MQLRDARADLVEARDAERERHPPHRAEQVDRDRERGPRPVIEQHVLEQQRRPAARHLHHPVGDLAHLEMRGDGLPNADELAGLVDGGDEIGE